MSIPGRTEISTRVADSDLKIEPFDEARIEPASYDCRLGEVVAAGIGRIDWKDRNEFILESNSWASVASEEQFELPKGIPGRIRTRKISRPGTWNL
ncbi:MAG: hypothetical protein GDA53_07005 [Rhodobacteraceae bacterium]|nr:hypothetical protein [Paracoccaceae bacterium]